MREGRVRVKWGRFVFLNITYQCGLVNFDFETGDFNGINKLSVKLVSYA